MSEVETTDLAIRADPAQLRHRLENLLGSALRHGGVGATDGGFYVADGGPGIRKMDRDAVFDSGYSTATGGRASASSSSSTSSTPTAGRSRSPGAGRVGTRFDITGVERESRAPAPN